MTAGIKALDCLQSVFSLHVYKSSTMRWGGQGAGALPIFGASKTSAFSTNAQSRFVSVVLDGVLGPPHVLRQT